MIVFTGSRPVGLSIIAEAGRTKPEQRSIKKVIAELGGKNCVVVDEDADLDEAVKGVLHSAFGYAGQKCSACSRVVVIGAAYDTFVKRLCAAAANIIVGDPSEPGTFLPPVVDHEAQARILATIAHAKRTERCVFEGTTPKGGCFVPATIFADVSPTAPIWRDEIFGPVVAIRQAKTFEAAIAEANDSIYALTGGVFSRSPKNLEYAQRKFKVGNLYLNRKITGAFVYRQPFGGFKMSGIGSKAGGPDYLIQFMEPKTITENTLRRGFAP
jgi:RHH-type proline utilization regulon transcriptional repressor/proline dehydrogenase/delta 1-pyrroline-5-carboxylate dehydrogenase